MFSSGCSTISSTSFSWAQKLENKDKAATIIQKYVRRYLQIKRNQKTFLDRCLFKRYYPLCITQPDLTKRINIYGNTDVYFSEHLPGLIMKHSKTASLPRLRTMQKIHALLQKQGSTHLIIPKARTCKDFLVEEKLPISENIFHNIGIYATSPRLFDEAVKEISRLFFSVTIPDLVGNRNNYRYINGCRDIRYDNLPLYILDKNGTKCGYIGLIDLGKIKYCASPHAAKLLARIFPLHESVIQEQALAQNLCADKIGRDLEEGRKYLDVFYFNHLLFLKTKNITPQNNLPFALDPHLQWEMIPFMESILLEMNDGKYRLSEGCQRTRPLPKWFLRSLEDKKKTTQLVGKVTALLTDNLKNSLTHPNVLSCAIKDTIILEDARLLSLRSPCILKRCLWSGVVTVLNPFVNSLEPDDLTVIADYLCDRFLEELVAKGQLYYYSHDRSYDYCWLRF